MAQLRIHDWRGAAASALLNQRWYEAFGNLVLHGLSVVPGSAGMKATIQAGSGLIAGLTFVESEDLLDAVTLAIGHATLPRIDAIVAQYVRVETEPVATVTYMVVSGVPSANPVPPVLAANQLLLAHVRVPPMASLLTVEMITNAPKLRDRIQALVPYGVLTRRDQPLYLEGVVWKRSTDPTLDSTIKVQIGDIWCKDSDSPPSYYSWDGERWVDLQAWDSIKNKPSSMPPEEHELGGAIHTGNLPLSRVSGHTAFGPPAHQEAFAMTFLRRP